MSSQFAEIHICGDCNGMRIMTIVNGSNSQRVDFEYLIGAYEVNDCWYLAAVTGAKYVSNIWNIRKIENVKVVQISEKGDNDVKELIEDSLKLCSLYFSTTNDLSLSLQSQVKRWKSRKSFIWNEKPLEKLKSIYNDKFNNIVVNVIAGFVVCFKYDDFILSIVSRRSNKRAGARYWCRGADENGYVANFVETEQLILKGNKMYSYVQIRGSIPVSWKQTPTLKILPSIEVGDEKDCNDVIKKHFNLLRKEYGNIVAISLSDVRGREGALTNKYNELGSNIDGISYHYFNFSKECSKLRYNNVSLLLNEIKDDFDSIGYCYVENGVLMNEQSGVLRINCIDCLDRTGVVQKVSAEVIFKKQLQINESIPTECQLLLNNAWTDNADAISLQYGGTRALKGDYTRTGKRTVIGAIQDGLKSSLRCYINHCEDGHRQDEYTAVTQITRCTNYQKPKSNFFLLFILLFKLISYLFYLIIKSNESKDRIKGQIERIVIKNPCIGYNKGSKQNC